MANSAQARKRARQNVSQRDRNTSLRSELRTAIKHVRKGIEFQPIKPMHKLRSRHPSAR